MIKVEPTAESLELQIGVTARGNRVAESLAAVKDEVNSPWAAAPVLSEVVEESAMAAILQEPMKEDTRDSSIYP